MTDSVNAGADDVKRANYGSKLEQWRAMQESGCNVSTLQRRDVPTSRRSNVTTLGQPIHKSTIKNVATSQRMLQRHDVSTRSAPHHLKHQWFRNWGIERRTNEGIELQSSSDTDFEEVPLICIVSHLLDIRLMFLRLNIFIFSFSMF